MLATVSSSSELSIDGVWGCGEPRVVVTGEACSAGNSSSGASEGLDNSVRAFRVERGRSLIGRTGLGAPSRKSTFPKAHELGLLWFLSGGLTLLGINSSDGAPSREDRARPVQLVLDDFEWLAGRNPWEAGISMEKRFVSVQLVANDLDWLWGISPWEGGASNDERGTSVQSAADIVCFNLEPTNSPDGRTILEGLERLTPFVSLLVSAIAARGGKPPLEFTVGEDTISPQSSSSSSSSLLFPSSV